MLPHGGNQCAEWSVANRPRATEFGKILAEKSERLDAHVFFRWLQSEFGTIAATCHPIPCGNQSKPSRFRPKSTEYLY